MGEAKRRRAQEALLRNVDVEPSTDTRSVPRGCTVEEAVELLSKSVAAYDKHASEFAGNWEVEARFFQYAPPRTQVQIWVRREGSFVQWQLWDILNVETQSVETRDQWLATVVKDGLVDHCIAASRFIPAVDDRQNCALFEFHPRRFGSMHPIGQRAVQLHGAPFTKSVLDSLTSAGRSLETRALETQQLRKTLLRNNRQHLKALELAMFFHAFCANGRQIFKFPTRITDLFLRTDVDGLPLEELQLPFDTFYMHFGPQERFAVDGWTPDGVYVSQVGEGANRVIQFAMTFAPDATVIYDHHKEYPEPVYVQALDSAKLKIGIGEAVDLVYSQKVAELKRQMEEGMGKEELAEAQRRAPPGVEIVDAVKKNAAVELSFIGGQHEEWTQLLRLIVNGLAYISAYPEDRERRFGDDAPDDLVRAANHGMGKDARAAESKLQKLGYTAIHFCGTKSGFANEPGDRAHADDTEGSGFTWVRGHWRRVVHGQGRTLRTWKWFMPVRRSINRPAGDEPGHVYLVS